MEPLEVYKYFVTIRYTCFLSALIWPVLTLDDRKKNDQMFYFVNLHVQNSMSTF